MPKRVDVVRFTMDWVRLIDVPDSEGVAARKPLGLGDRSLDVSKFCPGAGLGELDTPSEGGVGLVKLIWSGGSYSCRWFRKWRENRLTAFVGGATLVSTVEFVRGRGAARASFEAFECGGV
ncbi:hypothetical protein HYQ46_000148 [Verticillium longisporum]|nr:hypothetical protein HYQ46_000148 [Verticillium longisporum]